MKSTEEKIEIEKDKAKKIKVTNVYEDFYKICNTLKDEAVCVDISGIDSTDMRGFYRGLLVGLTAYSGTIDTTDKNKFFLDLNKDMRKALDDIKNFD